MDHSVPAIISVIYLLVHLSDGGENSPPVLSLDRRWMVSDSEPIGSIVVRARGSDGEGAPLVYGLEHLEDFNIGLPVDKRPLPFRIDNVTGVVYTNQSLADRTGEDLNLYVTVSDGKLTQKSAIWVTILNGSDPTSHHRADRFPRPPAGLTRFNQGGQPRPPFNSGPPISVLPPAVAAATARPSPTTKAPITKQEDSSTPQNHFISTNSSITSTTTSKPLNKTITTSTTIKPISIHPPVDTTTSSPPVDSTLTVSIPPPTPSPTAYDLALTIVPVILISIMFGLAAIAAFLFRKRICRFKKNNKEVVKKSWKGIRDDAMVMQPPRVLKNRYEAWDSVPPQQNGNGTSCESNDSPEKPVDRWEYPRHQLKVFNILGEGCFGQVWRCEAKNIDGHEGLTIVAVKTLKENAGESERKDLLQELAVMKTLDPHPNVVRLLGCCTDKDPVFVIMEYVTKGKLQSFLRNSRAQRCYDNLHGKSSSLTSRNLTSFCHQVSRGMQFLASKGIIHRDLAARNVLVADDLSCKVADFGFARDVTGTNLYERKSEGRLPIRWMAPESLYDNLFTVKSDVWSLGVLIWEVVTLGSTPYPGLSAGEVLRKVRDGYRLEKPEHCRRELYNIMYYCWDKDPNKRPDFEELVSLLEQLLLTETDYIELQLFPDHSYYNIVSLSGEKL